MPSINEKLKKMYLIESEGFIETLYNGIDILSEQPEEKEIINEMFRAAHTLKGNSASLGFQKIAQLTHNLENLLDELRNSKIIFNENIEELLIDSVDIIKQGVSEIKEKNTDDIEIKDIINRYETLKSIDTVKNKIKVEFNLKDEEIDEILKSKDNYYLIKAVLDEGCLIKSARAFLLINELTDKFNIKKIVPEEKALEEELFDDYFYILIFSEQTMQEVEEILDEYKEEIKFFEVKELKKNESILKEQYLVKTPAFIKRISIESGSSVKVDADIIDELIMKSNELKIELKILQANINNKRLKEITEDENISSGFIRLRRIANRIQQISVNSRLVPLGLIFNKFPRLVKNVASKLDKKIDLKISGEDVEVDKFIADRLGEPMIHLIRNSLGHGIEPPQARLKAGKPQTGIIEIKAYHKANNIFIEIIDDGAGIDPERVAAKALEKGMITKYEIDAMTPEEKLNLITRPGFSTAEKITELSGRGVGMDVVKTMINKLRGGLIIDSEKNKGTKITLRIPLTVAVIPVMIAKDADYYYCIPLDSIEAVVDIEQKAYAEKNIYFDKQNIDLLRIKDIYNQKYDVGDIFPKKAIILKNDKKYIAVTVDALVEQEEIVINPISEFLGEIKGISGLTILKDGSPAVILELMEMIKK